jgi:5-methyltetrahydropteroyltriglutamate--homocysteine methyltransferase
MSDPSTLEMHASAFIPGIFPRSPRLVRATRDLDRGRTTPDAVAGELARDRHALIDAQQAAGLDVLADGMLEWQDLFRPLVERCQGLEPGPLTRFLDTNTFFRAPTVTGSPLLVDPIPAPVLPSGGWVGTLPSPYALSRAVAGAVDATALARDVLRPQIKAWAAAGATLIVLEEPFLAHTPDGITELAHALEALAPPCPLLLRLPFADAAPVLARIAELPISGVGIDCYATRLEAIPRNLPLTLYAGVLDARNSTLEQPSEIAAYARKLADLEPAALALGPNGDLQLVPEPIAREKLARLGQARHQLAHAA